MGQRLAKLATWLGYDVPTRTFSDIDPVSVNQVLYELANGIGTSVSREDALSVAAMLRGRNLLCSISTLPLIQLDSMDRPRRLPLLTQIDPDVPNVVTLAQTVEDLVFEGISWWEIIGWDASDYPVSARHLSHTSVSLQPPGGRNPAPLPGGYDPRQAAIWVDGRPVTGSRVIRFDSPNPGVLRSGARAIRRALLLDKAAATYADDPRALGYFAPTDGADPAGDEDVVKILDSWKAARKARSTGYIPASMKYENVDSPSPADLQLVDLQKQVTLEIANALGLDPEDLGVSTTSRTYANATDRRRDRINDVLSPYMQAVTDRLSMGDVTVAGCRVTWDLDDYLRADPVTRTTYYKAMKDMGALTVEEIRREEKLPLVPEIGTLQAPVMSPAAISPPAAGRPALAAVPALSAAQFADPDGVTFASAEPMTIVDTETRTIRGRALPYGPHAVAQKGTRRFRFAEGAVRWPADLGRVKLLQDHSWALPLGRATELENRADGLYAAFKVGRGADGDRALASAADGVRDGLSVGVVWDEADERPDPLNPGSTLVLSAMLREISTTPAPSFDDARVTSVAASRSTEGTTVPEADDTTTGTVALAVPDPPPPPPVNFSVADLGAALQAAFPGMTGRAAVDPTRPLAVTEPAPYVIDRKGTLLRGTHDFSADLMAAARGDLAASQRATEFAQGQFDVITTNVDELNPVRNRPEMYVDQRDYQYPVWNAIEKGTLQDITPFTFPKFSSASGLVAAHTEGTEPTSGTFVTTSQTVTPTALSGKAKISRETWDQGGNPQISNLIWRQMTKAWYEALEAAAVAVLDAATPTGIDFSGSPGMGDDDLDQAITAAFASLQFIRGGFSMTDMFTQIDLYKALVAATDASGRRLYPAINPMNATGTVSRRFAAIDINGVTALPAWALAATGSVAASSYLFDRDCVHGWATAPQRLDFNIEVANVYIGLWGYKATAISDITGVREIIYDPV